ncbi:hypothetical protein PGT21_008660 [Puccinia graminis f. sp. tritici]|uniref:Uncharacterized protein n=1 Tax=Puccinia graminis f. sp. tritici TaxID=56615 RepID=A0A5B0LY97_PUCGR|nr:hypothetical protein PGT21_008660 [Puccinia graminis f. sp. tritici]
MKLATLITCLFLGSHIQGGMRPGESYIPDNRYKALQYAISLDQADGNLCKPSKIDYHMSDDFTRSDNGESVRCIFNVKEGKVHINNPFNENCYAGVLQDGVLLKDKDGHSSLKHFTKNELGKHMGNLETPYSSKETTLQVQYWVTPPVERVVAKD